MSERVFLAADLGASSGRVLAGQFDGQQLRLEEVHRFGNGGVQLGNQLCWNLPGLWSDIKLGLRMARDRYGEVASVGVDTWGVDFALLGRNDELLGSPVHYRDQRTAGMPERAFATVSRDEIFAESGLQFLSFNTLYQLAAMRQQNSSVLEAAETFLMMPDLFHWLLTGEKANEFTDASTTQFLNPQTQQWSTSLLEKFQIPTGMLQPIAMPGTVLGTLRDQVAHETGLNGLKVILPGTHDTASAVMAVPTTASKTGSPNWCYISSGTWSLMGAEIPAPIVSDECARLNFTNEGGVGGTIRLLKNIGGLWLVQECQRLWAQQDEEYSWSQLVDLAQQSPPLQSLINPDDPRFLAPDHMPTAIQEFCRETNQPVPGSPGEIIRCALESLALRYRVVLDDLQTLLGSQFEVVHIVGGGTQNQLLCQMTADACHCRVVAGPVEATAIGNIMMQAVACEDVSNIAEAREVVRRSFDVVEYEPQQDDRWDAALAKVRNW